MLLLPLLSSCISDDLSVEGDNGNGEMAVGARYVNYAAFRLNSSDGGTIATNWDSNDDKATSTLDKGTGFERMLYFPEPPETNEGEEETENPDNTAAADFEGGDDEEKSDSQLYHFAIIFDAEGNKMTDLLPLDLEFSSDDKPYVTVYSKIYTIEENPFGNKFDGNVLVVFNASYSLQQKIEKDLATNSNLQKFLAYPLEKGLSNDIDNFLYLKDKEDKYITDDSGNRYFTMTSSMVIKEGKLVPAMTGDFKVFSTEEKAKKNPTSLYIERLASKFTVVFKNGSKYSMNSSTLICEVFVSAPFVMAA